jgi:hypothetical protein
VALPESKPAAYVIIPTTVAFHRPGEVAGEEARNILLDATIVCDGPSLYAVVVMRNSDISRITHDVDDPFVSGIETLMALQNSRAREIQQDPVWKEVDLGDS